MTTDYLRTVNREGCDACGRPAREFMLDELQLKRCIRCVHGALQDEIRAGNQLRRALNESAWAPGLPHDADIRAALREVLSVVSHGARKQGGSWRQHGASFHLYKAAGHHRREGHSLGSGRLHRAHAIARELFALQLELEREGRS